MMISQVQIASSESDRKATTTNGYQKEVPGYYAGHWVPISGNLYEVSMICAEIKLSLEPGGNFDC